MKLLITCPPMIQRIENYEKELKDYEVTIPEFTQVMTEKGLISIIGEFDAWIVGDDPVTRSVLEKALNLKILVKWGIGTDNIDLDFVRERGFPFSNTPGMFGNEVADIAIGYLIALTRKLYPIHQKVKNGEWYKPTGISLEGKKVGLIGFGDIGRNIADRLISLKTEVHVFDPGFVFRNNQIECVYNSEIKIGERLNQVKMVNEEELFEKTKILIIACAANKENYHFVIHNKISKMDNNSFIINVSRGTLVKEEDVIQNLENGKLEGYASDVFETEPLPKSSLLSKYDNVILGSHNASNTLEAVDKTSIKALKFIEQIKNKESKNQ